MKYKCECGELFEKPAPSYVQRRTIDGQEEEFFAGYCCPNCGGMIYSEVSDDEI